MASPTGGSLSTPQGQHRAVGLSDDLFGDAAEEHSGGTPSAVGAHDDQVDVVLLGVVEDHLTGRKAFDLGFLQGKGLGLVGLDDLGHLGVRNLEQVLQDVRGLWESALRRSRVALVEDDSVQHVQLGLELLGEEQRMVQGLLGRLREIGGVEDGVDVQHGLPSHSVSFGESTSRVRRA